MTREQFYHSREWRNLVELLKQERTDKDGLLRCEMCGKPIVKKWDCIGHHKQELNEVTANDASIALNPDNVALIHFKCHNQVHERYGAAKQKVYLVYGCPKAGKTYWVNENATDDDLIIDSERLRKAISNGGSNRLKANLFGIRDALIDQVRTRTGSWKNAWLIGTYPLKTDRDRLCDLLRAEPIFIDTPEQECLARCETDEERRYVKEWTQSHTE